MIVGCFGYLSVSVAGLISPTYGQTLFKYMLPLYAPGEFGMILWLLITG